MRRAFETGAHDRGVVFIQTDDANRIKPCAPNKVLVSDIVTIEPNGLFFPTAFQTKKGVVMTQAQAILDKLIKPEWRKGEFIPIDRNIALEIIDKVEKTLEFDDDEFEWDAIRALLSYYSTLSDCGDGKVMLLAETDRALNRGKSGDKSGRSLIGRTTRTKIDATSRSNPTLILLQQEGSIALGWGGHKFWWPILVAPTTVEPCVFASKVAD